MFRRTRKYDIKWKPSKCFLFVRKTRCLGYGISETGSTIDQRMLESIRTMSPHDNPKTLLSHISLFSFSRDYIKNLGKLDAALRPFIKNWNGWGQEQIEVGEEIKGRFTEAPPLSPIDWERPFTLQTDGSGLGWGAALLQPKEKVSVDITWKPDNDKKDFNIVGFVSGAMKKEGMSYAATKGELFALKQATKKFDRILRGRKFHVQCDCQALVKGIDNIRGDFLGYMATWACELRTRYDFTLEYIAGPKMILADAFSRMRNRPGTQSNDQPTEKKKQASLPKFIEKLDKAAIIQGQQENISVIQHIKGREMIEGIYFKEGKLIVPDKIKIMLTEAVHRSHGHPGSNETLRRLRQQYYFPGMGKTTRQVLRECKPCIEHNVNNRRKQTNEKTTRATRPFQVIAIDPVPRDTTKKGNKYLLVICDRFTKLAKLIPIVNKEAKTIIQAITDNWIRFYPAPEAICTDHDSALTSMEWKNFCASFNITERPAAPKHQKSTGLEPNWGSIKTIMSKLIEESKGKEWDEIATRAENIFNQKRHSTTKMSPYEAAFGSQATNADNPMLAITAQPAQNQNIYKELTRKHDPSQDKFHNFKPGDLIRFRNTSNRLRKGFNRKNLGPYKITELQCSELVRITEIPFGPRLNHLNRLQHVNDLMLDTTKRINSNSNDSPSGIQSSPEA